MMKKHYIAFMAAAAITALPAPAQPWDLQSLLNKAGNALGDKETVSNIVEGLFTTSDLDIKDLAGEWMVKGSAVSAKSDNAFGKATSLAGAAMLEGKLDPYYTKYGLTGSQFQISKEGNFSLKVKKLDIKGSIEKDKNGNFMFHFNSFGGKSIGPVEAYVIKSNKSLNIMFDTARLQEILNGIASFSNMKIAKQAVKLLESYDEIYVGFKLEPYQGANKN